MSGTEDKAKGKFHEIKGKVKEEVGKLANSPELETEGKDEKIAGKVQKKILQRQNSVGFCKSLKSINFSLSSES